MASRQFLLFQLSFFVVGVSGTLFAISAIRFRDLVKLLFPIRWPAAFQLFCLLIGFPVLPLPDVLCAVYAIRPSSKITAAWKEPVALPYVPWNALCIPSDRLILQCFFPVLNLAWDFAVFCRILELPR